MSEETIKLLSGTGAYSDRHSSPAVKPAIKPASNNSNNNNNFPENVGILAMEIYYPAQYVDQSKLEQFDNVSTGKYTIGLGQLRMSFCLDNEDINSICLTVLNNLMDKYSIKPEEIGRLDVGTETLIDKSKSVKSTLMSLFEKSGNTDVEGVDSVNACFGGTSALFNAINWIESSYWDGRYAAVVMGDLALYAKGSARPTGGAGTIAILIGPNAPLVFDRGLRSLHICHTYDFYKPVMDSEYPIVDGKLSISCYLNALDKCYQLFKSKYRRAAENNDFNNNSNNNNSEKSKSQEDKSLSSGKNKKFNLNAADAFLFHSPYCKLVQKSLARLLWNDYLDSEIEMLSEEERKNDTNGSGCLKLSEKVECAEALCLEKFKSLTDEETFIDKNLEKELVRLSEKLFKAKTAPSLLFAREIGNMYTPSLYSCLVSYLLSKPIENLIDSRVCLFSYGSGSASAMFSLTIRNHSDCSADRPSRFSLEKILNTLKSQKQNLQDKRVEIEPILYDRYLKHRELINKKVPRESKLDIKSLYPGTWYLKSIDEHFRRVYDRVSTTADFDPTQAREVLRKELSSL